MVRDPIKRSKLRSTLIIIILATLPCYLLGMIVLWIGNAAKHQVTVTPTISATATISPWGSTATQTLPPIPTSPDFPTLTSTITSTLTPTVTFVIPSDTPTNTPVPSETPTVTETPPPTETETPIVTETTVAP